MAFIELVDYNEEYITDKPKRKKARRAKSKKVEDVAPAVEEAVVVEEAPAVVEEAHVVTEAKEKTNNSEEKEEKGE
jgi:hypothetical protein